MPYLLLDNDIRFPIMGVRILSGEIRRQYCVHIWWHNLTFCSLAYHFIPWGVIGIENDTPVVGNILLFGSRGFKRMDFRSMISPVPFVFLLPLVSD